MSEVQVKKVVPLSHQTRVFMTSVHAHNTYVARPRYEDTLQDVLQPEYWRHHCGLMRADDFIDVIPEGSEWYARLLVVHADRFSAKVKVLQYTPLVDQVARKESAGGFKVDRNGKWWRVIRIADQAVMQTGFNAEAEASAWIAQNTEA